MTRSPVRLLLWAEEPCQAAYLEAVLEMEAPGLASVTPCGDIATLSQEAQRGCDIILIAVAGDARVEDAAWDLPTLGSPVIVVAPWLPDFKQVHHLMRLGAEDVLGLAELSPRRLVAAVVKAVERRSRWHAPLRSHPLEAAPLVEELASTEEAQPVC
jgi:hypothetical protein